MKLTKIAILALRGIRKDRKERLANVLNASLPTVYRWIEENDDNLTKAAALKFIREETGLSDEDILEVEVMTQI